MDIFDIFAATKDLSPMQMGVRAFVVFFAALLLIRIAGSRSLGLHSPFDAIITLLLGALLSRSIYGDSPFLSIITASFVLVILHRFVAMLALKYPSIGKIVKGQSKLLFKNGSMQKKNMDRSLVSEHDLIESMRLDGNISNKALLKEAYMERNGKISIVKDE